MIKVRIISTALLKLIYEIAFIDHLVQPLVIFLDFLWQTFTKWVKSFEIVILDKYTNQNSNYLKSTAAPSMINKKKQG